MEKVKLVVIGAGLRGMYTYGNYIEEHKETCEVVALVEGKKGRRELFKKRFNLSEDKVFENIDEFFKEDKMADGVIVCNYDSLHFRTASLALEKGYAVLLEGPLCNNLDEIIRLEEFGNKKGENLILPAMPYRYSKFFAKIKEIIDEKILGELININYNSYIGYEKFTHNYVRGNWRIDSDSATLMLTNSCYDLDMLVYLSGSRCKKISSFGRLNHFTRDKFTGNMSEVCVRCGIIEECPYSAQKIYLQEEKGINKGVHVNPTKENVDKMLKNSNYGRCVYYCDNDTYDNVISILQFENNISANLNIIGLSDKEKTELKLTFSRGELIGTLENREIKLKKFISDKEEIIEIEEENLDYKLIEKFIYTINKKETENINTVLHSHIVAFAGEFANVSDSVIDVDDFYKESINLTEFMTDVLM